MFRDDGGFKVCPARIAAGYAELTAALDDEVFAIDAGGIGVHGNRPAAFVYDDHILGINAGLTGVDAQLCRTRNGHTAGFIVDSVIGLICAVTCGGGNFVIARHCTVADGAFLALQPNLQIHLLGIFNINE